MMRAILIGLLLLLATPALAHDEESPATDAVASPPWGPWTLLLYGELVASPVYGGWFQNHEGCVRAGRQADINRSSHDKKSRILFTCFSVIQ